MAWDNITVGDFGFDGKLTLTKDGVAQNISSYTTRQFLLKGPTDTSETTYTATFDTDGTNGVLKYAFQSGEIDEAGAWHVRARISKTGSRLTSATHIFVVGS